MATWTWRPAVLFVAYSALAFPSFGSRATAQTIINVPPQFAPSTVPANTIVNLLDGGSLGGTVALAGSQVNILGGTGSYVTGRAGSLLTMTGGLMSTSLDVEGMLDFAGGRAKRLYTISGHAEISGGAFGALAANEGASVELQGVGFRVNGADLAGLTSPGDAVAINLANDDILSGVLADGTGFAVRQTGQVRSGTLTLVQTASPVIGPAETIVLSTVSARARVVQGQTLVLAEGARLPEYFRAGPGSAIEINGGYLSDKSQVIGGSVVVNSGGIGYEGELYDGATLEVRGGRVNQTSLFDGTTLEMYGGEFAGRAFVGATVNVHQSESLNLQLDRGSKATVTGGRTSSIAGSGELHILGGRHASLNMSESSTLIEGGVFESLFTFRNDSDVTLVGSSFRLDGQPLIGLTGVGDAVILPLAEDHVLSGVFADGTPFAFNGGPSISVPLRLRRSGDLAPGPSVIEVPTAPAPAGITAGQRLILREGGALPNAFTAIEGSRLDIEGGTVGAGLELVGATATITGGVLQGIQAYAGAEVTLGGAAQTGSLTLYPGARGLITGGTFSWTTASKGSVLTIRGGKSNGSFNAQDALVEISGGSIGDYQTHNRIGNSRMTMTGGDVNDLDVVGNSQLTATGGRADIVEVSTGSRATLDGIYVNSLGSSESAAVEVAGGVVNGAFANGGSISVRGGALGDRIGAQRGVVEFYG
jgi:hypothetical protein